MTLTSESVEAWTAATWIDAAVARTLVTLPSGEEGRLVYVGPRSGKAKVLVSGRYRRLPVALLTVPVS